MRMFVLFVALVLVMIFVTVVIMMIMMMMTTKMMMKVIIKKIASIMRFARSKVDWFAVRVKSCNNILNRL